MPREGVERAMETVMAKSDRLPRKARTSCFKQCWEGPPREEML